MEHVIGVAAECLDWSLEAASVAFDREAHWGLRTVAGLVLAAAATAVVAGLGVLAWIMVHGVWTALHGAS